MGSCISVVLAAESGLGAGAGVCPPLCKNEEVEMDLKGR